MGDLNRVFLIGHLGRDPEIRTTQSGDKIATLNLATTDRWKDKTSGEKKEKTEWHRVVIFGPLAAVADQFLRKGALIHVEGKLQTRKWMDQSGVDRYTTEIAVTQHDGSMQMLDRPGDTGGSHQEPDGYNRDHQRESGRSSTGGSRPDMDDEIPF